MAIKKTDNGRWRVDVEPIKGRRFRKTFDTKGEALRFEAHIKKQTYNPEWLPVKKDVRRVSELVQLWYDLHGINLTDHKKMLSRLRRLAVALGDPVAQNLSPSDFIAYRNQRLQSSISGKTLNVELGFLRSVFNELYRLEQINYKNPLELVKPLRLQEQELTFLSKDQVKQLLASAREKTLNPHIYSLCLICLHTGSRWSEAESVSPDKLKSGRIVFSNTKSYKVRAVPVSKDLIAHLRKHWRKHGPFTSSLPTFNRVLERSGLVLPEGQASHVLRHTFASHFVQNGGNILTLQKILGHSSLMMTMRYAHLAPDHLQEAVTLNPCADFDTLATP